MHRNKLFPLLLALPLILAISGMTGHNISAQETESLDIRLAKVSLPFIQNIGRHDDSVKYYVNTFAGTVFVTESDIAYSFSGTEQNKALAIKEKFLGNPIHPQGIDKSITQVNYFVGNQENWRSNIPTYDTVYLGTVWPSIDVSLKAYGNNIEKIFKISPSADPNDIRIQVEGIKHISVNNKGELLLDSELGMITLSSPAAYQEIDGTRNHVLVDYSLKDNVYGFTVGEYDRDHDLIIDPFLASTFLGGTEGGVSNWNEFSNSIITDSSGNVFVTGSTVSSDFPTTLGAYDTSHAGSSGGTGGTDVFVSKLDNSLSTLLASTFLGLGYESGDSITRDVSDNVFIASNDMFISKLNNDLSSLLALTIIGGSSSDVALDSSGNVFITGYTSLSDFPTTSGAYDTSFNGGNDPFVAKLDSNLSANNSPTANAGLDQTVNEGVAVTLDGTASSDADGDTVTYAWTQTTGTSVTLSSSTASQPTFTAPSVDADTALTFSLVVTDSNDAPSSPDTVTITVNDVPTVTFTISLNGTAPVKTAVDKETVVQKDISLKITGGYGCTVGKLVPTPPLSGTITVDEDMFDLENIQISAGKAGSKAIKFTAKVDDGTANKGTVTGSLSLARGIDCDTPLNVAAKTGKNTLSAKVNGTKYNADRKTATGELTFDSATNSLEPASGNYIVSQSGTAKLSKTVGSYTKGNHDISVQLNANYTYSQADGLSYDINNGTLSIDDSTFDVIINKFQIAGNNLLLTYMTNIPENQGKITATMKFTTAIDFEGTTNQDSTKGTLTVQIKETNKKLVFSVKNPSGGIEFS